MVATGQSYSVSEFLQEAFSCLDPNCSKDVKIDTRFWGPGEVDVQQGDAFKAYGTLGWKPRVGFKELVRMMVDADVELS